MNSQLGGISFTGMGVARELLSSNVEKGGSGVWVIGVVLVTLASILSTIGIIVMKVSGDMEARQAWVTYVIWCGGVALMVLGAFMDFAAFGFAAQSLIAPLGSVTLVCNAVLSPYLLGTEISRMDVMTTLIIAGGCSLSITFGEHTTRFYTVDELSTMFDNTAVYIFFSAVISTSVGCYGTINWLEIRARAAIAKEEAEFAASAASAEMVQPATSTSSGVGAATGSGSGAGISANATEIDLEGAGNSTHLSVQTGSPERGVAEDEGFSDREQRLVVEMLAHIPKNWHMPHACLYAYMGGTLGSCSVLFGKTVAEMLKGVFRAEPDLSAWSSWQLYCFLSAMLFTLVLQMNFLNQGLRYHDTMIVVPVYQTFWILGGVIGGGVYFKELENLTGWQLFFFVLGVCITVCGVFALTWSRQKTEDQVFQRESPSGTPEVSPGATSPTPLVPDAGSRTAHENPVVGGTRSASSTPSSTPRREGAAPGAYPVSARPVAITKKVSETTLGLEADVASEQPVDTRL